MIGLSRRGRFASVIGLMTGMGLAGTAQAAGYQLREQSAEGQGNAFAGSTAKALDYSTLFFNPAGMTKLDTGGSATLSWIAPETRFEKSSATVGGAQISGGNGGDALEDAATPAIYAMYNAGPGWKFGVALNTPWGLVTQYDDDWVGRYHGVKSRLYTVNFTPSAAYKINDRLSVAAGIQAQYIKAELTTAINFKGINPLLPDGLGTAIGDDFGVGYVLSALYEPLPDTRIGLSWRSEVEHELHGEGTFDAPAPLAASPNFRPANVSAKVTTPDVVSAGIYHEISPQWAVMGDVSWTRWSVFKELRIDFDSAAPDAVTAENWKDSWFFSVGAIYKPNDKWEFHAGAAYDQSPVPDEFRTPRIPDSDRIWASFGAGYHFTRDTVLNGAYTHVFGDEASLDLASSTDLTPSGNVSGKYESSVDIFAISLTTKF